MFRHTSITKGVSFDKVSKRWLGRFTENGVTHYVGRFKEEADAAQAVNRARVNIKNSYYLRNELKDELLWEKEQINLNAPRMSPVQEWNTLTLRQLKEAAETRGITSDDIVGDKRLKQNWIDVLVDRDVRPMTNKEPEISAAIDEIDEIIDYLDRDEETDRKFSDKAVLGLAEIEWSACVVDDPDEPAYFWCNCGFLYTLYPTEGYTVWRYDETVSGNYKPIGVWNGPQMDENEEQPETLWEVSVDKAAGTYCRMDKAEDPEEGEILENWKEGAVMSSPLSDNRNHSFKLGKSAKKH